MKREEDKIDFKDYFVVDPSSPTGLRWRDDVKRFENNSRGGNCWGGTPAGNRKAPKGKVKYVIVTLNKKRYVVSRIIWTILHGNIPKGMIIDHLDGDPWNNNPSNLVCKTRAENIRNCAKRKDNTSGVVGVRFVVKDSYTFCVGTYQDINKNSKTAQFSVNKYGLLPAFKMAVEFRLNGIKKMNEQHNFKYTDRHIGVGI